MRPQRKAVALVGTSPSVLRYSRALPDENLTQWLRELAGLRPHFGYRRLHVLLQREGLAHNRKKTYRFYTHEKLHLRPKKRRRIKSQGRVTPASCYKMWTMDFVHDNLACGRCFRA